MIAEYQCRTCEVAAICRSTFDVDPYHIPNLLTTPNDYSLLIKCSIILFNNKPSNLKKIPAHLQVLLGCDRRLAYKMLSFLLQGIRLDKHIFSEAIADLLPGYQQSADGWTEMPNSRWIYAKTTTSQEQFSQTVYFDLLGGCLLIDGKPLGQLPRKYSGNTTYLRVFGQVKFMVY